MMGVKKAPRDPASIRGAMATDCPLCQSRAPRRCVDLYGKLLQDPHSARINAWLKAGGDVSV